MKKLFLTFSVIFLFLLTGCQLFISEGISKIEFYSGWELGEPYRTLVGSSENNSNLEKAYFDLAMYPVETLSTINIKMIGTKNGENILDYKENIDLNDYEVWRRIYKNYGYYILRNIKLDGYVGKDFDLCINISGRTKIGRTYNYTYKCKADIKTY